MIGTENGDVLDGGPGGDTLDGGAGGDRLQGGPGHDTYRAGDGDAILDADGRGAVLLGGVELRGGARGAGDHHYTDGHGHRYQLFGGTLKVAGPGGGVAIGGFDREAADLGIRLRDGGKAEALRGFGHAFGIVSPIALDLDGDGIATLPVGGGVHFDHGGDGFAELTGWVNGRDGLLARDLDGDGRITAGRELFGSNTALACGGLALAGLDGNGDGLIDARDPAHAGLVVWVDADRDGRTGAGELLSLAEAKVQSIATTYAHGGHTEHGNAFKQVSHYTRADGSVGKTADIWFKTDDIHSVAANPLPPTPEVAALPDAAGHRNLHSLHQAMLRDASGHLQALVQHFADAPATRRFQMVDGILHAWVGVGHVPPGSRGGHIDARQLAVLEALTGQPFLQGSGINGGTPNPGPNAAAYLAGLYHDLARVVYRELMDSHFAPLLDSVRFNWNAAADRFDPDVADTAAALRRLYAQGGDALLEIGAFADTLRRHGEPGARVLDALSLRGDLGGGLAGLLTASFMAGGDHNDTLLAGANGGRLFGLGGADTLSGSHGHDLLDGGPGDDRLVGGRGDDSYLFGPGGGRDTIYESDATPGNRDSLHLGAGIAPSGVGLVRDGYDLVVTIDGGGQVTVQNFGAHPKHRVEQISFADGTVWDVAQFYGQLIGAPPAGGDGYDLLAAWFDETAALQGLGGNDSLFGNNVDDLLDGGAGDDALDGSGGNDTLDGGPGNDTLDGGPGNDEYLFNPGDGRDILNGDSHTDTLRFGAGIAPADIALTRSGRHLLITVADGNGQLTISNFGLGGGHRIGGIAFADGTAWDAAHLHGLVARLPAIGTSGGDTLNAWNGHDNLLQGLDGNDRLNGGDGNDTLDGGTGADFLVGRTGDDHYVADSAGDVVVETAGQGMDTLERGFDSDHSLANNVERLIITGTVHRGNGNALDNVITGNWAGNNLAGWAGDDLLHGLDGDDALLGGGGDDTLDGGEGDDSLSGNEGGDVLHGNDGADALFGGDGADTLAGGAGGDFYQIDNVGDTIEELADGGDDMVRSTVGYALPAHVERLALDGAADAPATGNDLNNGLWGNAGNNILTGLGGDDYLVGGGGDDTYVFNRGGGQDTIDDADAPGAQDTLRFGAGIRETDVVVRVSGDGLSLSLNISGGNDRVWLWRHNAAEDRKIDRVEFADGTVWSQADLQVWADRAANNRRPVINSFLPTLQARAGSAFARTVPTDAITDPDPWDAVAYSARLADGSALPAWLRFDAASRTFAGTPGEGDVGGLRLILWGTDNYGFAVGMHVNLNVAPPNRPPVVAAPLADQNAALGRPFSHTLPATAFTDPDADPLTYSAALADGGALPAWLSFDPATRVFSGTPEAPGAIGVLVTATDTGGLAASAAFAIGVSAPNLTLTGTSAADVLTGGAGHDTLNGLGGNDTLAGNGGNDRLNGGAGADRMAGGAGDDVYVVEQSTDTVTESANAGTDSVESRASHTLAANVEHLALTGTAAINGTGNGLANGLTGNGAANILVGNAGNDRLDGMAGADTLIGGTGADTVLLAEAVPSTDRVVINAGDSLPGGFDTVADFRLGTGGGAVGVDQLDLPATTIAANTRGVDGTDVGGLRSHAISAGIVSFDDTDSFAAPLALDLGQVAAAFGYLRANLSGGQTVAFIAGGHSHVFQDVGADDLVVQLTGVTATHLSTGGLAAGGAWLV